MLFIYLFYNNQMLQIFYKVTNIFINQGCIKLHP